MRDQPDKADDDEPTPPKKKTEERAPAMARVPPFSGGDKPYLDVMGSILPQPPAGGFTEEQYRGLVPSRETANAVASARASRSGDQNAADTARIARAAVDTHGTTPKTATDLNPTPKTPQSPVAKAPGGMPPAADTVAAAVDQSMYGGTKPKDYGRVSAVELPSGKKVYGGTSELAGLVDKGAGAWGTKPGVGEETQNIRAKGGTKAYGPGTGPIARSNGFMGIKPGAPAGTMAYDRAASSSQPFSEQLRSLHSESSDPIQQLEYRKYIDRRIAEEQGTELGEAGMAAKQAEYDYAQRQAALDPMAALQMQARIKAAPEYAKASAEASQTAQLEAKIMPLLAAMAAAKDQGDERKYNEIARLLISAYGRHPPGAENPLAALLASMGTSGAPAAGAVK